MHRPDESQKASGCHVILFNVQTDAAAQLLPTLQHGGHSVAITGDLEQAIREVKSASQSILVIGVLDSQAAALCTAVTLMPDDESVATLILNPEDSPGGALSVQELRVGPIVVSAKRPLHCDKAIEEAHAILLSRKGVFRCGNTFLFSRSNELMTPAGCFRLEPSHAELLQLLMTRFPGYVSRAEIQEKIVGFVSDARSSAPRNKVYELRKKLAEVGADVDIICSRGQGWQQKRRSPPGQIEKSASPSKNHT